MSDALIIAEERIKTLEKEIVNLKQTIQQMLDSPMGRDAVVVTPIVRTPFDDLKELLNTEKWPFAINPSLICDITSEQDKEDRAEGILDIIIDVHLAGLRFLDFGCGEGHVVSRSKLQNPALSVGYDIKESSRWTEFAGEKTKFTSKWDEVTANAPYDVILMYDVIDHIVNEDPVTVLKRLRPLLKPGGRFFVRCHPFTSRHATHLYHKLNKAYVHLVFTDEELESMGLGMGHKVVKVIHPMITYNDYFAKAGFRLANQPQVQKEPVEPFFINTPMIAERIKSHWVTSHDEALRTGRQFPFVQLEQQFADYILL